MQDALKRIASEPTTTTEKSITLYLQSQIILLIGDWQWDMESQAVYCSEVMSFPPAFEGTKSIIHPDDLNKLKSSIELFPELKELSFRIITTYGEVKSIYGTSLTISFSTTSSIQDTYAEQELTSLWYKKELEIIGQQHMIDIVERLHGIGTWYLNKSTGKVWYSDNVYYLHGIAPQSLNVHANTFLPFIHPDDYSIVTEAFELAYANEIPLHLEYRIIHSDETIHYLEHITQWSFTSRGELIYKGIIKDITDERKKDKQFEEAETITEVNRHILMQAGQQCGYGFFYINLVTRKTHFSDNYCRLLGIRQNTSINNDIIVSQIHPEDQIATKMLMDDLYKKQSLPEHEFRIMRPNGAIKYLKQSGKLFVQGDEIFMAGILQDITVQKGNELRINELTNKLNQHRYITDVMEQELILGSIIWFPNQSMYWSDGLYRLLGLKPGSVLATHSLFFRQVYKEDIIPLKEAFRCVTNGYEHAPLHFRLLSRGGLKQLKISFHSIKEPEKCTLIAMVQEESKELILEKQLYEKEELLRLLKEYVGDLILVTDIHNTIIHWNHSTEKRTNIEAADAVRKNLFDTFPALRNESYLAQLQEALNVNKIDVLRARDTYLHKPHHYILVPVRNAQNEVSAVLHVIRDISKEMELQQQLKQRLGFIEKLVEASVDRIIVLDQHLNYLYWNKKAEEFYSINKERVIGKNVLEIFPGLQNDPGFQEFRRVLKGETVYLSPLVNGDHKEYFETYLIPVKNDEGETTSILWIAHDLQAAFTLEEERINTVLLLQKEHGLLKEAQAIGHIGSFEWHSTSDEIYWSDELYRIHGLEPQSERINLNRAISFIHPEDSGIIPDILATRDQESRFDQVHRIIRTDGQVRFVRRQIKSYSDNGEVIHLVGSIQDITEQKLHDQELLQLKEATANKATDRYQALFSALEDAFCIVEMEFDKEGNAVDMIFIETNAAFEKHTGMAMEGKRVKEILPHYEPFWLEQYGYVAKTGKPVRLENVVSDLANQWFQTSAVRIGSEENKLVAILFRNITERRNEERRKNFLLELNDSVRNIADPAVIIASVADKILNYFGADRCYYSEIDGQNAIIRRDARKGDLPSVEGTYPLSSFALFKKLFDSDKPLVVENVYTSELIDDALKPICVQLQLISFINIPVIRGGKTDGILCIAQKEPGKWSKADVTLAIETAERTWAAVKRAKALEDLLRSEEQFRNLAETLEEQVILGTAELQKNVTILKEAENLAKIGSWEYNPDSGDFYWSEGMFYLFNMPPGINVSPQIYIDFALQEDRSIAKKIVTCLKKLQPFEESLRIRSEEKAFRLLKVKGTPVQNSEGKVYKMVGVDLDITDISQAEHNLSITKKWLEETANASPDSITVYDLQEKQPVYLNECLGNWIGYSSEELISLGIQGRLALIHPDDRLRLLHFNELIAASNDAAIFTLEYRLQRKSGDYIWIRNRSKVFLRDHKGKVTHAISFLEDISEEKELALQLKERTKFTEDILDNSINRVLVLDSELNVIAWNRRCEEYYHVKKQDVIGKHIFDQFPRIKQDEEIIQAIQNAFNGAITFIPKHKSIYSNDISELFYVPLKHEEGPVYGVLCIAHDITRRIEVETELISLNNTLEEKNKELENKNEEITHFAFVASHDLKEPLRKIHTFSDWLLQKEMENLSPVGKNYIFKITEASRRMQTLIEDILVLTKIHTDKEKKNDIDLNLVLEKAKEELANSIAGREAIISSDELPMLNGNENQLQYLFTNLISNAIKFQKPDTKPLISISAEIVEAGELIEKDVKPGREYVKLCFADNGIGIEKKYQKKIFQIFQRLYSRHEFEGTGMGLAICKTIMENHDGFISVYSEEGKGSQFCCYFPL